MSPSTGNDISACSLLTMLELVQKNSRVCSMKSRLRAEAGPGDLMIETCYACGSNAIPCSPALVQVRFVDI